MADALMINKADGENKQRAMQAKNEYQNALHLFPPPESGWTAKVDVCSAQTEEGIENVWHYIQDYKNHTKANGYFVQRRNRQAKMVMYETINQHLKDNFYQNNSIQEKRREMEEKLLDSQVSPYNAARELLNVYFGEKL